jgi:amino acid transporter
MKDFADKAAPPPTIDSDCSDAGLRRSSIGLVEVLFQGLGVMAPALGVAASLAFAFAQAGPAAPLVFVIAMFATVLVALA